MLVVKDRVNTLFVSLETFSPVYTQLDRKCRKSTKTEMNLFKGFGIFPNILESLGSRNLAEPRY